MMIKKAELVKIFIGAILAAAGSVVMELANRNDMYETISEEVSKQLSTQEAADQEDGEES